MDSERTGDQSIGIEDTIDKAIEKLDTLTDKEVDALFIRAHERAKKYEAMSVPEPDPIEGDDVVVDWLVEWMRLGRHYTIRAAADTAKLINERHNFGVDKYGTPLQANNGRNPVEDARQEMGDLLLYVAQAKMEGRDMSELKRLHSVLGELLDHGT